jgi:hypothetical protein
VRGVAKFLIRRLLGERATGALDYLRFPEDRDPWGGAFNGQRFRLRIFAELLHRFAIAAIVETGTFRGGTTALFAATGVPVYSAEIDPRNYGHARARLIGSGKHLHLYNLESVSFLRGLSRDPAVPKQDVLFYLDAHWQDHLPLRDELDVILGGWRDPIVMIDDFCVPGTTYGFDSYGPDATLNLAYIDDLLRANLLSAFFPAASPSDETGQRRGAIVLCPSARASAIDNRVSTLVRAGSPPP